jgi:threonine aldolase
VEELHAVAELAKRLGLRMHMDGARLCNALATLGVAPKEITWKIGVDVLCFGLTKNGLLGGEAVVFFNKALAEEFDYRCKQGGQLSSKMRFLSAPWIPMLREGVAMRNAGHANAMTRRLEAGIRSIPQVTILFPCEANAVFVRMDKGVQRRMREAGWRFHDYPAAGGQRLMCAWDTKEEDVDRLVTDLREAVARTD